MTTILITGGAGFVGSNLAIGFTEHFSDARVIALDNLHRRGSEMNLERLRSHGVVFAHGDVRVREDLEAVGSFDWLIECSAEPSVHAGYANSPSYLVNSNLVGMLNCLEVVRRHHAAMAFLSTSRVYPVPSLRNLKMSETESRFELSDEQPIPGASSQGISEDFPLSGYRTLYGATKLCAEIMLQEYIAAYDLRGVINRCGTIAGAWQMGKVDQGFVALWVAAHVYRFGLSYVGFGGSGKQVRDVLHVDDLLRLLVRQVEPIGECNGEIYNVGGGRDCSVSLLELTAACRELTGRTVPITAEPDTHPTDIPIYLCDAAQIHRASRWKPERGIGDILRDIYDWVLNNGNQLKWVLNGE